MQVYPMKREIFEKRFPRKPKMSRGDLYVSCEESTELYDTAMGFVPGGQMRQQFYEDPYELADLDTGNTSREPGLASSEEAVVCGRCGWMYETRVDDNGRRLRITSLVIVHRNHRPL